MPLPTATLIVDQNSGYVEELSRDARGWVGQRNYLVSTDIAEEAMLCPELPAMGAKWSGRLPMLVVKRIGPVVRLGGRDDGTRVGWSRVPVFYETASFGGLKTPEPGQSHDAWTAWVPSVGTQRVYSPIQRSVEGGTVPADAPIENGQGADIYVGQFEARVTAFYPLAEALPVQEWVALSERATLNHAAMELPRVYGSSRRFAFARGQVLYLGPGAIEAVADTWVKVEHVLKVARLWDKRWQVEDAQGRATETFVSDRLYEYADLSDLWRTV